MVRPSDPLADIRLVMSTKTQEGIEVLPLSSKLWGNANYRTFLRQRLINLGEAHLLGEVTLVQRELSPSKPPKKDKNS